MNLPPMLQLAPFASLPSLLLLLLLPAGCGKSPTATGTTPGERVFAARGEVRSLDPAQRVAVIRHEDIPGYMPRMVMALTVRNPEELNGLAPGDLVTFQLHATLETHWIDQLVRVGRASNAPPASATTTNSTAPASSVPELKIGDRLPDQALRSETGGLIQLADFRGRAVAFTFFFTRCPLPDFCPKMNREFSEARDRLAHQADAPTNWQFLCISFDPAFDTPAVLTGYARAFRGNDTKGWLFAAAPPEVLADWAPRLDLKVERDGGSFAHNLRTVVLDTEGRIARQFDGNRWTADELVDAMIDAAKPKAALNSPSGNPSP